MQVDDALIDRLSRLAMLDFTADERGKIKADLEKMIGFVDKLREVDTTGVEPLLHMSNAVNAWRNDEPGPMLPRETALANAPHHSETYFQVPKVIKKPE